MQVASMESLGSIEKILAISIHTLIDDLFKLFVNFENFFETKYLPSKTNSKSNFFFFFKV